MTSLVAWDWMDKFFFENSKPQNGCFFFLSAGNTNSISASLYYSGQTRWCHPKVLQKGIALFQSVCVFFSGCSNSINLNSHTSWVLLLEYMEVSPTNRMDHVITDLLEICKMDRQDWCFGTCNSNVKCGCFWGKPSTAGTFKKAMISMVATLFSVPRFFIVR